jgi:hypothetical protein
VIGVDPGKVRSVTIKIEPDSIAVAAIEYLPRGEAGEKLEELLGQYKLVKIEDEPELVEGA